MKPQPNRYLVAILILSVLLRVGVAFYLGDEVDAPAMLTDQRSYHTLGARLITGHGFSFPTGWYPFTLPDVPTAHWSFLYSLFVAVVYGIFGIHPLAVRLISAILGGLLLPWMAYRLTQRIFSAPASGNQQTCHNKEENPQQLLPLMTALLVVVYAYFILYAATLMTETLYIVALLWSLERTLIFAEKPIARRGLLLGLSLGIATLLRQSILPWVGILFTWLLWVGRYRRQTRQIAVNLLGVIVVLAAMILPFTIHNYRVYGEFLLLNSNAGYAMYSAQHPMHGTDFQPFAAAPIPDELWGLNEAQLDKELMRRGISFVLDDPIRYARLCLSRVGSYFEFWPTPDTTLLHNVGRIGSFGLFMPLILYGLWLAIRHPERYYVPMRVPFSITSIALILLFTAFYSLLHILTWAMPRYRLPVDAVMLPFAALALLDVINQMNIFHGLLWPIHRDRI